MWNKLPYDLRSIESPSIFKDKLLKHLWNEQEPYLSAVNFAEKCGTALASFGKKCGKSAADFCENAVKVRSIFAKVRYIFLKMRQKCGKYLHNAVLILFLASKPRRE